MKYLFIMCSCALILSSCQNNKKDNTDSSSSQQPSVVKRTPQLKLSSNKKGDSLVKNMVDKTGSDQLESATVHFVIGGDHYKVRRICGQYRFEKWFLNTKRDTVKVVMDNIDLTKYVGGQKRELSDQDKAEITDSLRSVVFLTELPFGLNASTVRKKFIKSDTVNGKKYEQIKLQFIRRNSQNAELKTYVIWVDQDNQPTFIATITPKKHLRFLQFTNRRSVGGVKFADRKVYRSKTPVALSLATKEFNDNKFEKLKTDMLNHLEVEKHDKDCD